MSLPISSYLSKITSQFQNSTKFLNFLNAILSVPNDISTCVDLINAAFVFDNAVGVQLDMIGVILGRSRTLPFQPNDGSSAVLDDDIYRIILKAKIAINQWDGQVGSLPGLWAALFPSNYIMIRDNQNMTLDVAITPIHAPSFNMLVRDIIRNGFIVPRPEGVLITFHWGRILPYFGYDLENDYFAGYDVGNWTVSEIEPPTFGYDVDNTVIIPDFITGFGYDSGFWD